MKNKESLKIITDSITERCHPCSCSDCIESSGPCLEYRAIKQIEKDLEVLEILKSILNNSYLFMIKNEKDYLKVKEWLNDK